MSMGTGAGRSEMATPFPGSPGSATIGASAPRSKTSSESYTTSSPEARSPQARRASGSGVPRRSERKRAVVSSGATMPENAPASAAMFVRVARSSTERAVTPSPAYSSTFPIAPPPFTYGCARSASMTSFAATPGGRVPLRTTRIVAGTFTRTSPESHAHATSVVPLEDEGMADALARSMEPNALRGRELFLPRREGIRERQEAARLAFLRHDLAEEGQVIAKQEDGARIPHARLEPQRLHEAFGRHRRDVFVGEAQVGPH